MRYMVPLEQRRRLAELYGDNTVLSAEPLACADQVIPEPAPEPPAGRCYTCGYTLTSIGHQVTCGGDS